MANEQKITPGKRQGIDQRVLLMAVPVCQSLDCEVVDVEWKKEGANWYLRVFIDRETGVDLDLCSDVSHALSDALDVDEFIEPQYILEVSSPGVERPLKKAKDFQRFAGSKAVVKLYSPLEGKKQFAGKLLGYAEQGVKILNDEDKREYCFTLEQISKAHLVFEF